MSVLGCEVLSADSSEVPTQTDGSSSAKSVPVADAAPPCGGSRLVVTGATVAQT